jgi:hypothetical protein
MEPWTAEKVAKSQAAHGVSVVEVQQAGGRWRVARPSRWARRITARTPMRVSGPAAGHALLRTAADPEGRTVLGTVNNCAHGATPWGTYLTCEENFNAYFVHGGEVPAAHKRYGITAKGSGYRWHEHDARFDAAAHPNEPNRFGWVVEIDPYDAARPPVKHTALGRFKHEGAAVTLSADGRAVVYMGDDERFEYIYKFVSRRRHDPKNRLANLTLLEDGTLYVARFEADGSGIWVPLVYGREGLDAGAGFASQAEVLVNARAVADRVGATKMDRPEWIAVHPRTGEAYCALTNNTNRGREGLPGPDTANPRSQNAFGHIIRWRERGGDASETAFAWDVFVLAGDPQHAEPAKRGTVQGRRLRLPGRPLVRRARRAVDPDRCLDRRARQGRLRGARQQHDARGRPRPPRSTAFPGRPQGRRDHRCDHHARPPDDVRQHPASGGEPERARRPEATHGGERLARRHRRKAAALRHRCHPQAGRGRDRDLRLALATRGARTLEIGDRATRIGHDRGDDLDDELRSDGVPRAVRLGLRKHTCHRPREILQRDAGRATGDRRDAGASGGRGTVSRRRPASRV